MSLTATPSLVMSPIITKEQDAVVSPIPTISRDKRITPPLPSIEELRGAGVEAVFDSYQLKKPYKLKGEGEFNLFREIQGEDYGYIIKDSGYGTDLIFSRMVNGKPQRTNLLIDYNRDELARKSKFERMTYALTKYLDYDILDFYVDVDANKILLVKPFVKTLLNPNPYYMNAVFIGNYEETVVTNSDDAQFDYNVSWNIWLPPTPSTDVNLYVVYPNSDKVIVNLVRGDRMMGSGALYLLDLNTHEAKKITDIRYGQEGSAGGGDGARLIRTYNHQLLLSDGSSYMERSDEKRLTNLYLLDPLTNQKTMLVKDMTKYGNFELSYDDSRCNLNADEICLMDSGAPFMKIDNIHYYNFNIKTKQLTTIQD